MPKKQFIIELDHPYGSFFPGQDVSGRIILYSTKEQKTEGITLKFSGSARAQWKVKKDKETHIYRSKEKYFNTQYYLFGKGSYKLTVPPGRHEYPFTFKLPVRLPSSFVGSFGMVYYELNATLKRSWKLDVNTCVPFTVNGILDLNMEPNANQVGKLNASKKLCCLFCKSGPVSILFQIPKRGFVPGETISADIEMINHSRKKVNGLTVTLLQKTIYHAQGHSKIETRVVCKKKCRGVLPGESESWRDDLFKIPPIPPSRLATCLIIDVEYILKVVGDLQGFSLNVKGDLPIIIGTIPLKTSFLQITNKTQTEYPKPPMSNVDVDSKEAESNQPSTSDSSSSTFRPFPSAPNFEEYPDLPPPSYGEAIQLQVSGEIGEGERFNEGMTIDEGTDEEKNKPSAPPPSAFKPTYLTYNF